MRKNRLLLLPLILGLFLLGLLRDVAANEDALRIHVVCPEHGEIVHAKATTHGQSELTTAPEDEHHSSCELADLGSLPTILGPTPPTVSAPEQWSEIAANLAPRGPPVTRSPLINAPKTSPPIG